MELERRGARVTSSAPPSCSTATIPDLEQAARGGEKAEDDVRAADR